MSKPILKEIVPLIIGESCCKLGPSNNQLFHFRNLLFERPFYNSRDPSLRDGINYLTQQREGPKLINYYVDEDLRKQFLDMQNVIKEKKLDADITKEIAPELYFLKEKREQKKSSKPKKKKK